MSTGNELHLSTVRAQENNAYEETEKMFIAKLYSTCTSHCLFKSISMSLDNKEKRCLSKCYDIIGQQIVNCSQSYERFNKDPEALEKLQ